ncbi:MAG: hypothetical protein K8W52_22730 [Deltaproteobacteria bacterium]|nr:hypothetical protein [Deltaproteobacteria bacterium]
MKNECRDRSLVLPLSPVQQGMYFHHLHKKNRVYLEQMLCDVDGPVELATVERSLNKLVEAHECLRTVFVNDDYEGPRQRVLPYRWRPLRYRDLSSERDPETAFAQHAADEMERNLALDAETSRCELVKLGPERHAFLWTYHHLIMDAWAVRLLQDQFCEAYLGVWKDSPRPPYRRYLEWIENQNEQKARAYWTKYLQHHACHADAVLPAADVYENQVTVTVECGARGRELLGTLARRHRATVNHVLLAAWGTYVLQHFQKAEAIFGCVVSGRMIRLPEVDQIGGVFVNAIPIYVRETETVTRTVAEIRQHMLVSSEYAFMSLSDVMAFGNTTPASVLSVVNFQIDHVELRGGAAASLPFRVRNIRYNEQAHYDVYLDVYVRERGLTLAVHYDARKHAFDAHAVQRALTRILERFEASADAALGDVALGDSELAYGALDFG